MKVPRGTTAAACLLAALAILSGSPGVRAQQLTPPGFEPAPRPPNNVPGVPPPMPGPTLAPPSAPMQLPGAPPPPPAAAAPPPAAPAAVVPPTPMVPAGQVALMVSARFGRDPPGITGGLHWRIYPDKPDPNGAFRVLREERAAAPIFVLPPGGYVVHVSFGLASATRRVQLRQETVREVFEIPAGGARFEGRVGDSKIPPGQITFDVFRGSQFEGGEKRAIVQGMTTNDVVLLPEGTYHVVSNYGDSNATVRSDIRVQAGRLTDVVINHRAAVITLKLVNEKGGEALANTGWSVLTPGGDVVKEAIGAFPKVVLAEGEYSVVARNEGKVFNGKFKVEPGVDREIEVMAR
jgi:hypothetical protein